MKITPSSVLRRTILTRMISLTIDKKCHVLLTMRDHIFSKMNSMGFGCFLLFLIVYKRIVRCSCVIAKGSHFDKYTFNSMSNDNGVKSTRRRVNRIDPIT